LETGRNYVKVDNCVFNRSDHFASGVGENLHNHASYTLSWTINQPNLYDLTWTSAAEYIAFQKGPMSSTGLSQLTGIEMTHVPYQGHAPAERAVLAEEVDFYLSPFLGHHLDHHKQGRLNILAVLTKTRDPRWPNYPAIGEFPRIQDLTFTMWTGFFVRKGIPEPVMQTLNQALAQSIPTDAVRTKVEAFNQRIPTMLNLAEAGRFYAQGVQEYRALAATVGLV